MQNHTIFRTNGTIATNILKLYIAWFCRFVNREIIPFLPYSIKNILSSSYKCNFLVQD